MTTPTIHTALLLVSDVARLLRVHEATIRGYIADGSLRAIKIGQTYRVEVAAVDELIELLKGAGDEHSPHRGDA